jgi:hypothetical protein
MPDEAYCEIPLRAKDGSVRAIALVDQPDYIDLSRHCWCCTSEGYAARYHKGIYVRMHRVIMGLSPGDGVQVDHINGNRLDNRRANLRVCTHAINNRNQKRTGYAGNASGVRGVTRAPSGAWRARVRIDGQLHHIGCFPTIELAGAAAEEFRTAHGLPSY